VFPKRSRRLARLLAFAVVAWAGAASTARADVQLSIHDGRVSLVAKDATVRQILTEWAKVGHTRIVNLERIPGGPLTIEFTDMPEQQALDVLLRAVSGYMAAPRATAVANQSQFDRIIVIPTSSAPRAATVSPAPAPFAQLPPQPPPFSPTDEDDEPRQPGPGGPPTRGPVFSPFPQPQVVNPQQRPGAPTPTPGAVAVVGGPQQSFPAPVVGGSPAFPAAAPGAQPTSQFGGASVPGMIVQPPPQQPGQVPPGAQPRRNPNED
jgi:hypothetical protein